MFDWNSWSKRCISFNIVVDFTDNYISCFVTVGQSTLRTNDCTMLTKRKAVFGACFYNVNFKKFHVPVLGKVQYESDRKVNELQCHGFRLWSFKHLNNWKLSQQLSLRTFIMISCTTQLRKQHRYSNTRKVKITFQDWMMS